MARQSLGDWLTEVVNDLDKGGRCTSLAVVHMKGAVEDVIHVKKVPEKIVADDVYKWADVLEDIAENYAAGLSGAQTFCIYAFHGNSERPTAKRPFIKKGYTELEDGMTESPTAKGLLTQMMRHVEAMSARTNEKDRIVFESLARTLDIKTRENEAIRRENIDNFGLIKELVLGLAGKQHEQRLAEIAAEQSALLRNEIVKWIPRLINTATGREIIPQNTDDTLLVEDLIDAVMASGDLGSALPALQNMKLPGPLMAKLATRIQRGFEARQREQNARKLTEDTSTANGLQ